MWKICPKMEPKLFFEFESHDPKTFLNWNTLKFSEVNKFKSTHFSGISIAGTNNFTDKQKIDLFFLYIRYKGYLM